MQKFDISCETHEMNNAHYVSYVCISDLSHKLTNFAMHGLNNAAQNTQLDATQLVCLNNYDCPLYY